MEEHTIRVCSGSEGPICGQQLRWHQERSLRLWTVSPTPQGREPVSNQAVGEAERNIVNILSTPESSTFLKKITLRHSFGQYKLR